MRRFFAVLAVVASVLCVGARASRPAFAATQDAMGEATVTLYAASWCGACKELARGLRERNIPFDLVDIDQNPRAYDTARKATGKNVVPITSVARGADDVTWIVGADVDAVEKAYRGS